ncbi:hypothetical protein HaLaN_23779, partial [Haematococcus lacustris]
MLPAHWTPSSASSGPELHPRSRTSVVAQAVKATEIKDYSDLATGHKVNPERRASQ